LEKKFIPLIMNKEDGARLLRYERNILRSLYTHSINGGALEKPGPNSARTRLVSPLARRGKIKKGCIYKVCNKANGGGYSRCISRSKVAVAAKN